MTYVTAILLSLGVIGAYAILAIGIVMIYRASRVLNLAHGAMAMVPPYVVYALSTHTVDPFWSVVFSILSGGAIAKAAYAVFARKRVATRARVLVAVACGAVLAGFLYTVFQTRAPLVVALPFGLVAGGALGWSVERFFIRPLRSEGPTAQTVGTVAALGILIAATAKVFGTTPLPAVSVFPKGQVTVGLSSIRYGEFILFAVMLVVTGALILLFKKTDLGLMMRGTAENRRAASLMGVDPDRMTGLAWIMGGTLAGLSGIMLASLTNLTPHVLSLQALPAFVAALIAGLTSLQGAVLGAVVVGASIGLVPTLPLVKDWQGARELFLAALAIAVMATRGRRIESGDTRGDGGGTIAVKAPREAVVRDPARTARRRRVAMLIGGAVFLAFPWVPSDTWFSVLGSANDAARFTLIATSLVLLVGWVGQISLGHAALVGIGGYVTGGLAAGLGIPFPLNLPIAVVVSAAIAALLGGVAVRVRGLYLAVATLIFSWMADSFLFRQGWLLKYGEIKDRTIGGNDLPLFGGFDFKDPRVFYFIAWAFAIAGLIAAANMRDSKTGRAFFAVRGSEMAAASLGIDVVRTKLVAFAVSGALAGAAGNLTMAQARALNPDSFSFTWSFFFLSIAVVGGLQSLGGGVAAAALFASLNFLFFKYEFFSGYLDIVSSGLLVIVLLAYREGLAAVPHSVARIADRIGRARVARAAARGAAVTGRALGREIAPIARPVARGGRAAGRGLARIAAVPRRAPTLLLRRFRPATSHARANSSGNGHAHNEIPSSSVLEGTGLAHALPEDRLERRSLIEVEGLTVRFGGLTAVSDVSLSVREGEIVGLIGPNGAGKTVTFNSISGLVTPTTGRVTLHGKNVTDMPVHLRAKLGLARTFQVIQLFGQLSVFENLLVATHVHNPTGLPAHVLATSRSIEHELESRERVQAVIDRLGLHDFAHRRVSDLPFGVLRMVEIARALVTGHPLIMLDEAASGLDNTETDKLSELLLLVRDFGVTLLLIEHDVKMVTSLSDYVYVLDRGILIAEGRPEEITRNPGVIAAYLGSSSSEPESVEVG